MTGSQAVFGETLKAIFFDLDDTLFDTHGQLVEPASRDACRAMIEAGMAASLKDALAIREQLFEADPRSDVYLKVANHFGASEGCGSTVDEIADCGRRAFYQRTVEPHISLFPGVQELLALLKTRYQLFLITSGDPSTQRQKVELLKLEPLFVSVSLVESAAGECKETVFADLMRRHRLSPQQVLVVGDRIDREIADGRALGTWTCQIVHGEYRHLKPLSPGEIPDFSLECVTGLTRLLRKAVPGAERQRVLAGREHLV